MKSKIKYIIAIVLIIIFTMSIVPKSFQNDTFYIIKLGDYIIQKGIDRVDHFSWHDNLEYRYPHWLFDVINSFIYSNFGLDGIYVFVCFMASIFMVTIFLFMLKKNINFYTAFLASLIISYLMKDSFSSRGQIISYLMFFLEINLIESFLKKKNILSVIGIFVTSCIVANVHATAWIMYLILFLPYIGEYAVSLYTLKNVAKHNIKKFEKKLAKLKNAEVKNEEKIKYCESELEHYRNFLNDYKERENNKIIIEKNDNAKWLALLVVVAILGALVTPLGDVPFTYFLKTSLGNTTSYISEHQPIVVACSIEITTFLIVFIAFFAFTDSKMKLSDAFLVLGLLIMTFCYRRNVYLLLPLASIPIVKLIDDFIKKNIKIDENNAEQNLVLLVIFALTGTVAIMISFYNFLNKLNEEYISETEYPVEATEYIKNNLDVDDIKLFNDYDYGAYLLWQDIPVFIDSRCDLYTEQFNKDVTVFDDYMKAYTGELSYQDLFEKYGITHALVYKNSVIRIYMAEDENCIELYSDDNFVLYQYNN